MTAHISQKARTAIALLPFVIVLMLAFWLFSRSTKLSVNWDEAKKILEVLQSGATILAIIAGGVWAYYNFFKGRIYKPRLEPKITGALFAKNGENFLIVTAQLKNVGLSAVRIDRKGSALRLFAYTDPPDFSRVRKVQKTRLHTVDVFEEHGWIEPGEIIDDQRLFSLPKNGFVALSAEIRLVSDKIEWNAASIIQRGTALPSDVNSAPVLVTGNQNLITEAKNQNILSTGEQTSLEKIGTGFKNPDTNLANKEDVKKTENIENEKESGTD